MKMTRRTFMQASMFAMAASGLTACGDDASSSVEQVVNYALMSDPSILDTTQTNSSTDLIGICNSLVSLTTLQMVDGVLAPQPYGADSWSSSEDGLTWTFQLAKAVWEDDVPVTAQNYVDAFQRIIDPATGSVQAKTLYSFKNAEKIVAGELDASALGATAVDDYTLQIELEYYVPYFIDLTYGPCFCPVRLDVMQEQGSAFGTEADTLIACGAFKISEWVHDSHLTLVKNEKYFRADEVKLEQVNLHIIKDYNSILAELYSGTIDRSSVTSTEWREKLIETDNFDYGDFVLAGTCSLFYNAAHEQDGVKLLSNVKIRQAISATIDSEEAGSILNSGLAVVAQGIVPITLSIDGENFRDEAGYSPVDEISKITDPKAHFIEGLEELGLDPDPTKYKLNFLVRSTSTTERDKAEYFYEVFKSKIGFEIEIEQVETAVGYEMGQAGEFGITCSTNYSEYNDPIDLLGMYISNAGSNFDLGWVNETFDSNCAAASISLDHEERVALFTEAEKVAVADEAITFPIYHPISSMMTSKTVKGFQNEAATFAPTLFMTVYVVEA